MVIRRSCRVSSGFFFCNCDGLFTRSPTRTQSKLSRQPKNYCCPNGFDMIVAPAVTAQLYSRRYGSQIGPAVFALQSRPDLRLLSDPLTVQVTADVPTVPEVIVVG